MAKGGGGSWKVAYADFVTAMMAFFLVMWIGAQDVKVRQSVANYFVDPSGVNKRPVKEGAVLDATVAGPVPEATRTNTRPGVQTPASGKESPGTAAVLNWVNDPRVADRWKAEARRCREEAAAGKPVNETRTPDEIAAAQLAQLLSAELAGSVPKDAPDVHKDLLYGAFKEVNWDQVARSLLSG